MLGTDDVLIPFSLPQMKNQGITLELDPKGAKITCPTFGLYSSPVEYASLGHIPLDLTSLAYQPKSRERSSRQAKHVTFALSQRRSMPIQLVSRNWMTTKMTDLLLVQTTLPFLKKKMKMINFRCTLHQHGSVGLLQYAEFPHRYEAEKNLQSGEIRLPHWNKFCQNLV